ncbi:MAG: peptide-methionine (S)-S-oxide reductase MsrA [Verrucomicrobiae bacterium]|nr:peptide-methionine (S)-S-oxide reductase MsrA [Verrucomicrobiae bacterium]
MKTVPVTAPASTTADAPQEHERITFGGGCFWCIEAVFQRLNGVVGVVSGYAGGTVSNPTYEAVTTGKTGHAEVVQLTFDPVRVSYETLLKVFWAAHDPTSVLEEDTVIRGKRYPKGTAYQGADVGDHYRSIILYETDSQRVAAEASRIEAQKDFKKPIATQIVPLKAFYRAEDYHQNYYNLNKGQNPYCGYVITPKLQKLLRDGLIAAESVIP